MEGDLNQAIARRRSRRPLADCTNSFSAPRSAPKKPSPDSSKNFDTSVGSNPAGCHSSDAAASPVAKSLQFSACADGEKSKRQRIVKQKKQNRGKPVMAPIPMSCPPLGRTMSRGNKIGKRANDNPGQSKASTSRPRSTKKRRHSMPVDSFTLPQDFIDKQRAYFAEIDAYELEVEEVSASELE